MAEKRGPSLGASWVASGDLSGAQYRLVSFSGKDVYLPGSGAFLAGVLQNKPVDNAHADVEGAGYSKIFVANSLGAGIEVMAGNNGFAVQVTSGQDCAGRLITGAESGKVAEILINLHKKGAL